LQFMKRTQSEEANANISCFKNNSISSSKAQSNFYKKKF